MTRVPVTGWSRRVDSPDEARAALADPGDALDLRAAAPLDEEWAALGFSVLVPGELVRPLDVPLADLAATRALGARLGSALRAGDLVVLSGALGAGKTSLAQGLGAALGVRGAVTSPTFVLARAHRGPLPMLHVDAYRLRPAPGQAAGPAAELLADLDLDEALDNGVVVVEWGEGLVEALDESRLHVHLTRPAGEDVTQTAPGVRVVRVVPYGHRWSVLSPPD